MTIETLFLTIVTTYLVLVAYGVVGARRRRLSAQARLISGGLMVTIPPLAILGALYTTGDALLIAGWGAAMLAMLVGGVVVAVAAELIARRVGA